MRISWWFAVVAFLALAAPALAVQPDEILADANLEARARVISRELRCMVCQNQSIDDSDAPLARDLRILVRERLQAGDSDRQVIDFMVKRYGEFVLLRPRLSARTSLLWLAAPMLLIGGVAALWLLARRQRRAFARSAALTESRLTATEQARLAELLAAEDSPGRAGVSTK